MAVWKTRKAGLVYAIVGVFGGFSQGWFQPQLVVAGDPLATAAALEALAPWAPWGILADLVQAVAFLFLALELYRVFSPRAPELCRAFLVLVAGATTLMVASNALVWSAFEFRSAPDQAYLLASLERKGALMAQVFFGLWLVPWGWAGWKTRLLPRTLSALLMVGGVGYLVQLALTIADPAVAAVIGPVVVAAPAVAEIGAVGWLLVRGLEDRPASSV